MGEMTKACAEEWLDGVWRGMRDGYKGQDVDRIHGALMVLQYLGALSPVERDGWAARLRTCPGHDDEGGRAWCAFCGNLCTDCHMSKAVCFTKKTSGNERGCDDCCAHTQDCEPIKDGTTKATHAG